MRPPSCAATAAGEQNGKPPEPVNGETRKPVFKVGPIPCDRNTSVSAAVWANAVTHGADTFTVYNVTWEVRYRDQQTGEWKTAKGIRSSFVPTLNFCLTRCFEFACSQRDPARVPC